MFYIAPPNSDPDYNKLINKPSFLADNQVDWNEIQNIPSRISFLANTFGANYSPWVLSDFYSQRLEWLELTTSPSAYTMVQRNATGRVDGTSFKATALPTNAGSMSVGNFYRDSSGFVKVVI